MNVQIALKNPHTVYTNLDYIQGHVVLNLSNPASISNIVVKLEGESRTRLMGMGNPDIGERPRPRDELHKVIYQPKTVFPDASMEKIPGRNAVILQPGHHEFPFEYKAGLFIRFASLLTASPIGGSGQRPSLLSGAGPLSSAQKPAPLRHVKATLPPTLNNFPGMAEIRYYLKVTVGRKEFYKENPRVIQTFNFLPIEPPRMPPSSAEAYARRQHEFSSDTTSQRIKKAMSISGKQKDIFAPKITLDARLPNPPIITCNEKIPLRLLVIRQNDSPEPLYLNSLQIELIGSTHIRAHDIAHNENSSWLIMSRSNMATLLSSKKPVRKPSPQSEKTAVASEPDRPEEIPIDPTAWDVRIPNSVAPTFETCNITRKYDLYIQAGIGYGSNHNKNQVIIPLRLPILVYSGIHPPPALLDAMSSRPRANTIPKKPLSDEAISNISAVNAVKEGRAPSSTSSQPARPAVHRPQQGQDDEEPPPSYEDAMATELGPIDGPRDYQPPPVPAGAHGFDSGDEKGRGRRDS
ncbi:MAG: hypothetical protein M1828_006685 [Chrysothrix sp. TS-e1954]|nr:MAG: hypothetical protein M1828_006685 [Chrysothrix sp. TS-e1954]